jgi:soluble lytic murein transglycosylase-like protein
MPWQHAAPAPQHPVGRTRRRFPSASAPAQTPARYRRAFDGAGDRRVTDTGARRVSDGIRLPQRSTSSFDRIRRGPIKYGIVGVGVAGIAGPLAIARANEMRNDPSHERQMSVLPEITAPRVLSDHAVGQAWREARVEAAETKSTARDEVIQRNVQKYSEYDIPRPLAEDIYDIAMQENIDPDVAFGLVRTESAFKNSATSHVGAMGLTQLMPKTAAWLKPGTKARDLRDQRTNLRIGFKYLNQLIKRYDGDTELALLAYNRGPGTVDRVLKRGGNPDNGYPDMVLRGATARP